MDFAFITIIYHENPKVLAKKYSFISKSKNCEFIFILNRNAAPIPLTFNASDSKLVLKYKISSNLLSIAKRLDAKFVVPSKNGLSSARNEGAAFATSNVLIFTDEDIIPTKNWFFTIQSFFNNKRGDFCFGPDMPHMEKGLWGWWRNQYELHFSTRNQIEIETKVTPNNFFSCAGRNIAIKKSVFSNLGGYSNHFDHYFGEDLDLMTRATEQYHVWFLPQMKIWHIHPISINGLLKKFWQGGVADANWILVNNNSIPLGKAGKHYLSLLDGIWAIFTVILLILNFQLFVVIYLLYGAYKTFSLMKKKNPILNFVILSILILPLKSMLAFGGFIIEYFKRSFLN